MLEANDNNSSYNDRLARSEADREIPEARVIKLERKDQERATKNAKLKETMERYDSWVSLLEAENLNLQSRKVAVEVELDRNINETLAMLG